MSESDPKTPPEESPTIPDPDAPRMPESDTTEEVDAAMGAAVEPAPIDPTSEDLEGSELDDTEDRD